MLLPSTQVKAVDKEIFQAVRQQSGTTARSKQDLGVATGQLTELFGKVGHAAHMASGLPWCRLAPRGSWWWSLHADGLLLSRCHRAGNSQRNLIYCFLSGARYPAQGGGHGAVGDGDLQGHPQA